jgi:dolichyl-phosphate-mannose--protein O-mannosyl transferase
MSEPNNPPSDQKPAEPDQDSQTDQKPVPRPSNFWQAFMSATAAAFGVQSEKNRQKDFSGSSPWPYIFAGLVFTLLFIVILVGIVTLVLS